MASKIRSQRTALLLLDFQAGIIERIDKAEELLSRASEVAKAVRKAGGLVIHCRVCFTQEELDSAPATNPMLTRLKSSPEQSAQMLLDAPGAQFNPALAPQAGDLSIRKRRIGPFTNTPQDFDTVLREKGIDTLIVGGIATGGAVLATIVQAADLDYRLVLLKDACADPDPQTHEFLIKFLEKRATVIACAELEGLLD